MANYDFSLADYDDIPEIMNLYHSLIGTPGCTWSLDYPDSETAREDINKKCLYVLKENNTIISVASVREVDELSHLQWSPKKPCELARVGVMALFQNRGIGTIILQNVIEAVKKRGADGIILLVSKTNDAALSLYSKNGFIKCGEAFMYDIDF